MFERLQLIISEEDINKVKDKNILIVGVGGVGGACFEALVRLGVQKFTIIDNDVFDKNTKVIDCYVFLDEMPVDALRKFYLINNSLWTIQEITDYNYKSKEPTKVKLIRAKNKYNYIN